jgi:hypothetical protein
MGVLVCISDVGTGHEAGRINGTTMRQGGGEHAILALSHHPVDGHPRLMESSTNRLPAAPVRLFVCVVCGYIEIYSAVDKTRLTEYFDSTVKP